jgi:Acetoacetate decarboxylase (ADC)
MTPTPKLDFFAAPIEQAGIDVGADVVDLPLRYWRADRFLAIFSADVDRIRAILPSPKLHPLMLAPGRAALAVTVFNFHETSLGPYGEIAIAPLVTESAFAPPMLPLLAERILPWSGFIMHLPVTSRLGRDAGREIWNYPKFLADMDFDRFSDRQSARLEENGRHILTLTVAQRGIAKPDDNPTKTFTVQNGQLIKTTIRNRGVAQVNVGPNAGNLELGDHPIADELRAVGVSLKPWITKNSLDFQVLLPAGEPAGPASIDYDGYRGTDHDNARLTIRYSTTEQRTPYTPRPDQPRLHDLTTDPAIDGDHHDFDQT